MAYAISRGNLIRWLRSLFEGRTTESVPQDHRRLDGFEVRMSGEQFRIVRDHVENFRNGEEGGFILCGYARTEDRDVLLAREWIPVPDDEKVRGGRFGLEWTASFSARVLARADALQGGVVLVHSHGNTSRPGLSGDDRETAERLLSGFSRMLGRPCGSVVLGASAAVGIFFRDGSQAGALSLLRVVDSPIEVWLPTASVPSTRRGRRRLDRQNRAIGPKADAHLAGASIAVIGVCGGGSHVCQQLAHQGVGRIVPIDDDLVEEVNLGRMVGATPSDSERTPKAAVMRRLIASIDPEIRVEEVRARFPEGPTLAALKSVDVVISCVDSFLIREQINAFCRRHHLPLIDVGMSIRTKGEKLERAAGQMIVVLPDSSCLRCTPLLSDAVLERERSERPPGYDRNPDAIGEPQVVSMNGVLASEACNSALDLIAGYADGHRGAGWWGYDGRRGELTRYDLPSRRRGCPACAEQGHGDPSTRPFA
jgi:molybdopterin-synthase adenylyltransferase